MSEALERKLDAGEYVLGTLAADARAQFQQRLATDAELRGDVLWWERHLGALAAAIVPVAPRAIVWTHIALAAGLYRAASGDAAPRLWQALAGLATTASVLLGIALWQKSSEPPQILVQVQEKIVERPAPANYVAVLQIKDSPAQWLVSLTPDRKALHARVSGQHATEAGKYLHLWWLNPAGPVSLGVLADSGETRLELPANLDLDKGSGLAVSLEHKDKVPTAGPLGPVLVAAPVMKAI